MFYEIIPEIDARMGLNFNSLVDTSNTGNYTTSYQNKGYFMVTWPPMKRICLKPFHRPKMWNMKNYIVKGSSLVLVER